MKKKDKELAELLNTATARSVAREAEYHHKMTLEMAKTILTGEVNSEVVRYAEMLIDADKKMQELL